MAGTLSGAWTALITPFRNDAVDERALRELVEGQIKGGIDGLVPCGTTGESVNLSHAEFVKVIEVVVDQARGRVPVMAGTGTASTRHTIEFARAAKAAGASYQLVVSPYYNRPTQDGLYAHYRAIAEAVDLPIVLYNIPVRCGIDLALATMERLAGVPSIVGIKEATNTVQRSAEIVAKFGDRFAVISGDDALTLPIMAVGGQGVISVASNIVPAEVARQVDLFREGDLVGSRAQAQRLRALYEVLFIEASPGPAKAALAMMGKIAPEIRLPLVMPQPQTEARVRSVLSELGAL